MGAYDLVNKVQQTLPLFSGPGLSPSDFLVLRAIAAHENCTEQPDSLLDWFRASWASTTRLAYGSGVSVRTTGRALQTLRDHGMIEVWRDPVRPDRTYRRVCRAKLQEMVDSLPAWQLQWFAAQAEQRIRERSRQTEPIESSDALPIEPVDVTPIAATPEPKVPATASMRRKLVFEEDVPEAAPTLAPISVPAPQNTREAIIEAINAYALGGVPLEADDTMHETMRLLVSLYNHCDRPSRMATADALGTAFEKLNDLRGKVKYDRVRDVMQWVFSGAKAAWEWPTRIKLASDPAGYFFEKYSDQLERQYLAAAKKTSPVQSTPEPDPKAPWGRFDDGKPMGPAGNMDQGALMKKLRAKAAVKRAAKAAAAAEAGQTTGFVAAL